MTSVLHCEGEGGAVVVSGVEALNGLGFNAHQTWALARADVRAFKPSPFTAWSGHPIALGHIEVLPEEDFGAQRMHQVLTQLLSGWTRWLRGRVGPGRLAAAVSVSERFAAEQRHPRFAKERDQLTRALREAAGAVSPEPRCELHPYGHGGGAYSVQWASQRLLDGTADVALVIGLDTGYDPDVIEGLLEREQLNLGGIEGRIPGEGGALLVLSTAGFARDSGLPVLARLRGASVALEPNVSTAEPLGEGITQAVRGLTTALVSRGEKVDWWIGDVSNEASRVAELQMALPRFTADVAHPRSRMDLLPAHFGDLGAATIPTGLSIAVEAFTRRGTDAKRCLVWASSDGPTRGAVLIEPLEVSVDA